jgi:hypothetical protein
MSISFETGKRGGLSPNDRLQNALDRLNRRIKIDESIENGSQTTSWALLEVINAPGYESEKFCIQQVMSVFIEIYAVK